MVSGISYVEAVSEIQAVARYVAGRGRRESTCCDSGAEVLNGGVEVRDIGSDEESHSQAHTEQAEDARNLGVRLACEGLSLSKQTKSFI